MRKVKTYSIRKRKNKVKRRDFARAGKARATFRKFLTNLPRVLKAEDLKEVGRAILRARRKKRPVIFMLGAHVIKCGLAPVIIDLMKRKVITHLALNGAAAIHDFEIALIGETSEDVETALKRGTFGMAEETGYLMNEAINSGVVEGRGVGASLGEAIVRKKLRFANLSILASAFRLKIPVSVHIALGTDIIHQHPLCSGRLSGEGTMRDFQLLIESVERLSGGVAVNIGSAVLLPEVFLKAVNLARNRGKKLRNLTTANFDMIQHYRPRMNVVERPAAFGGKGFSITGHHEIMIPLLAQIIIEN